jgi:acetyltransferase
MMAKPGSVGFISQSGALCTAILDWSLQANFGFSAFISVGSMLDVGWGDLIDYLGDDPATHSIVIYMESVGDARAFLSAAREVALTKPIILIKAGRTTAAAKAAASHTGALAGSDQVLDAACRRVGILRVDQIEDLFLMSEVLAKQPRPNGPHLTIITNAGGPGVLATDALIRSGSELAEVSPEQIKNLSTFLPDSWSHGNPVDILGDADPQRYLQTVQAVGNDPASDGLLVILTPQAMTDPTATAERLRVCAKQGKPVLASWMGGTQVATGRALLTEAGIPTLPYPDTAARLFSYMWQYSYNLQGIYETPALVDDRLTPADHTAGANILDQAQAQDRTLLTELESKQLLAAYQIPTVDTRAAQSEDEAAQAAEQIGYPVVLKLLSETITHKTDVGGVRLNLRDQAAVRQAFRAIRQSVTEKVGAQHFGGVTVQQMIRLEGYEVILGSSLDAQFGPVLLFGAGGQLVEVIKDSVLGLPPLTTTLARRMMEQTRIFKAFKGVRGRAAIDLAALEKVLVRLSLLVVEQRRIKEIDINPLLVSPSGIIALDARVVLHPAGTAPADLPRSAIRPYPVQYRWPVTARDGLEAVIRPIRPEDEPLMVGFHKTLSEESVYHRFFNVLPLSTRVTHERLRRRCFIDYDREMALVAEHLDPKTNTHEILGVGRLSRIHGTPDAEFGLLISDRCQRRGLGTAILQRLIDVARQEGIRRLTADVMASNLGMQRVCERVGFQLRPNSEDQTVNAQILLDQPAPAAV